MSRPTGVCDERAKALKGLVVVSGSLYDACTRATRVAREDCAEADKAAAILLELRRVERLADEVKRLAAGVPR